MTKLRVLAENCLIFNANVRNELNYLKKYLSMGDQEVGYDLAYAYPELFGQFLANEYADQYEKMDPTDLDSVFNIIETIDRNDAIFSEFYERSKNTIGYDQDPYTPSYMFMDYRETLINSWMVHFTQNSMDIITNGFEIGTPDMSQLGLTTYISDKVKVGGYNFAYDVNDLSYAFSNSSTTKYGKEAVLFQATGIKVWHYGDEEPQVIFWGETAKNIVRIINADGLWVAGEDRNGAPVIEDESLDKVITWIIGNYDQYKSVL